MAAKPLGEEKSPAPSRGFTLARIAVIAALAVVVIALGVVLFGGSSGHKYNLLFQNASQLVPDNQVLIGGSAGRLGRQHRASPTNNLASVHVTVSQQLHEGTTAVIRATSLSGVANHYVSISPGPNSNPALEEGATLGLASTTTPVDIDQLFNTFPPAVRRGLSQFIQGNAAIYAGRGPRGQPDLQVLRPGAQPHHRLRPRAERRPAPLRALRRQLQQARHRGRPARQRALQRDLQRQHRLRRDRRQNVAFDQTLRLLPPVFRQSNTTFVNLRAALDDLDPLVDTAKPATKNLAPFLAELRPVLSKAVPLFKNLRLTVRRPGKANDAGELLAALPAVQQRAAKAFPHSEEAIAAFQPNLNFARAYTPDIFNGFAKLGQITGYYDANGHYARVQPADLNIFNYNSGSGELEPISPSQQYETLGSGETVKRRCPGGATQPAPDGSNPFVEPPFTGSGVTSSQCNPADVPPGPQRGVIAVAGRRGGRRRPARFPAAAAAAATSSAPSSTTAASWSRASRSASPGANVGEIESVDVSLPGEIDSYEHGKPEAVPGKAVIVMKIEDPGFQDFRGDATCLIRPQSLIGEKFVDCRPTLPRAPGTKPPPPLKKIPAGQPGAGQYLLPVENNSTSVDPDLINDIQTLPYAQRFRLILNELGAGLAGRGSDIEEVVKRANPVLRDADRLLRHPQRPAQPARPAGERLRDDPGPALARARPRRRLLRQRRRRRPGQLRTRPRTGSVAAQVPPVPARVPPHDAQPPGLLRRRHPGLRRFRQVEPGVHRSDPRPGPVHLGLDRRAEGARQRRRSRRPEVPRRRPGRQGPQPGPLGAPPTTNLAKFFVSTKKTRGWDGLVDLIYNTTASTNGFDQYGHFARSLVTLTNCARLTRRAATRIRHGCSGSTSPAQARIHRTGQRQPAWR